MFTGSLFSIIGKHQLLTIDTITQHIQTDLTSSIVGMISTAGNLLCF